MVAGHLQEKNGIYYIVLNYKDCNGKRKSKWISTKLPIKGNKKKAEAMLLEIRASYVPEDSPGTEDMLFADFMIKWLDIVKPAIAPATYSSYSNMVTKVIAPYFRDRRIKLSQLKPSDIQDFYTEQLKRVKANSVIH